MNDFLNAYQYFYTYKKAHREEEIRRNGLQPRRQVGYAPNAPGRSPIICLASLRHVKDYIKDQQASNQRIVVCRIPAAALSSMRLGLDWSSEGTMVALMQGTIAAFEYLAQPSQAPSVVYSIEEIGSLACYDPIPSEVIEIISADEVLRTEAEAAPALYDLADPLIISVSRDQVERGDTTEVLDILKQLMSSPEHMRHYKERVGLGFDGYDDDREPLFEKPEVRRFVVLLDQEFPYWFFFISRHFETLAFIGCCVVPPHLTEEARREINPLILQGWLENRWGPALNHACRMAGLPDEEAEALFESGLDCLMNGAKPLL